MVCSYSMCRIPFPHARSKFLEILQLDLKNYKLYENPVHTANDYQPPIENAEFCDTLKTVRIDYSLNFDDRFLRCRGQATRDFYTLRHGRFKRIPDIVVWPKCHDDVEIVVKMANKYQSVIIPYGGGRNVRIF